MQLGISQTGSYFPIKKGSNALSFGALKKTHFSGIELCCVNQFRAPIEKFNSNEDFNQWANKKINDILNSKKLLTPPLKTNPILELKPKRVSEWIDAMCGEDSKYKDKPAYGLIVLKSVFKDLDYSMDLLPSTVDVETLDLTIAQIEEELKLNPKKTFDFDKLYKKNLSKKYIDEEKQKQGIPSDYQKPFWIKIPAQKNAPDEFEENVQRLKAMSSPFWCTKNDHKAKGVLQGFEGGDFYICIRADEPKIGMRTKWDGVFDVQGKFNDFYVPYKYYDVIEGKITEIGASITTDSPYSKYRNFAKQAQDIWSKIPDAIVKKDYKTIMDYFGYNPTVLEDGSFEVETFRGYPSCLKYFEKYGISEEEFVGLIKKVKGDVFFSSSNLKTPLNIEEVGGNLFVNEGEMTSLGKIKRIGGNLNIYDSKIDDLGELEEIGGSFTPGSAPLKNLGKLKVIKGVAALSNEQVMHIKQLKEAGNMDILEMRYDILTKLNG